MKLKVFQAFCWNIYLGIQGFLFIEFLVNFWVKVFQHQRNALLLSELRRSFSNL